MIASRFAIYFDWMLGLRVGGPPGYLANLREGLREIGRADEVDFICLDSSRAHLPNGPKARAPLFSWGGSDQDRAKSKTAEAFEFAQFHARRDRLAISRDALRRLDPQARRIIHVHTTADAVKAHNTLTRHGCRHQVVLALTSHCPEVPAKEWAEKIFSEGASRESADAFYKNHLETDYLAFSVADVVVFPCREAMDPYVETMPGFAKLFGHRDVRFLLTGAMPLEQRGLRASTRSDLGIPKNAFVACYLGRHNQIKGYDILSRAGCEFLSGNSDAYMLIGGKAGEIATPSHPRWIEFGWTETPGDLVEASDVFVLANRQTYFDLVTLEVLSTGRIIIASNTGGNRWFAGKSDGVILYSSEEELLTALEHVKSLSSARRDEMERSNRKLYASQFSVSIFANGYLKLLQDIERDYAGVSGLPPSGKEPKISVIVPVYNVKNYLTKCLSSLTNQTFGDFEVLIVNDGSTDGGEAVIDEFVERDSRFKRLDRPNGGLSAARNTGLDNATGEYIAFLDSDDWFEPQMLEALIGACEKNDTKIAVCGVLMVNDDEQLVAKSTSFINDEIVYPYWRHGKISANLDVLSSIFPSAWNKLYHRSLFRNVRYNPGLYYEDHPVFYKLFTQVSEFSFVNEQLYAHRGRAEGRITRDGSRRVLDVFTILDFVESQIRAVVPASDVPRIVARVAARLIWERKWVVGDPGTLFRLAERAFMKFEAIGVHKDAVKRLLDADIDEAFLDEFEDLSRKNGGWWSWEKVSVDDGEALVIEDHTPNPIQSVHEFVSREGTSEYLLVHPVEGSLTTACVQGVGFFGSGKISLSACIEHEYAEHAEFRAFVSPFVLSDRLRLERDSDSAIIASTCWQTLSPLVRKDFDLDVQFGSPSMALYLQSRVPKGSSSSHNWLRVRDIRIEPTTKPA